MEKEFLAGISKDMDLEHFIHAQEVLISTYTEEIDSLKIQLNRLIEDHKSLKENILLKETIKDLLPPSVHLTNTPGARETLYMLADSNNRLELDNAILRANLRAVEDLLYTR